MFLMLLCIFTCLKNFYCFKCAYLILSFCILDSLKFVRGRRGCTWQLFHKGYIYKRERSTPDKVIWRCLEYERKKCLSRCHSANNKIVKEIGYHNHDVPFNENNMSISNTYFAYI